MARSRDIQTITAHAMQPTHVYEIRLSKDKCGVDLISDALPFGRLWYRLKNYVICAMVTVLAGCQTPATTAVT